MSNLLSNALKYSNGPIKIECSERERHMLISVTDSGMGIKPEDKPFIFDKFYRVNSKQTKDISGFGIGLYLSAEIIKLHGGDITPV